MLATNGRNFKALISGITFTVTSREYGITMTKRAPKLPASC